MILSRRAALTGALATLALPGLIRPAAAACAPADLAQGIAFRREDGSRGLARLDSAGVVRIDYVTNRGAWTDVRLAKNGVFEISRTVEENEEPVVGSSAPTYSWTYSPKIILPEDGRVWSGKVKETVEVTISDEAATVHRQKRRWTASYTCSNPRVVKLSGCSYDALTVEAAFVGEAGSRSQRWVYFPALGLGLETVRDGRSNGIVALTPA